jgi:hypothetical protein
MAIHTHVEQKEPVPNELPACWDLVIDEMKNRDQIGRERYKTALQPFNGRNALRDVSEELLDAVVYNRQLRFEIASLKNDLLQLKILLPVGGLSSELLASILTDYEFLHGS